MDWFLYDNGHRHERVKLENNSVKFLWREKKHDHNQYFEEPQSLFEFTQRWRNKPRVMFILTFILVKLYYIYHDSIL